MSSIRVLYRRYMPIRMRQMVPEPLRRLARTVFSEGEGREVKVNGAPGVPAGKGMMRRIDRRKLLKLMVSDDLARMQARMKRNPDVPFEAKALWNVLRRSEYAYGIYHAAQTASRLGQRRISVLEFGVAGGNGLLAMEAHARSVERIFPVQIEVYGFDTGEGLTPPEDHRDMPYMFAEGNYRMDVEKLQAALSRATLVLGDVKNTVTDFFQQYKPAPIAFVSMDLDYYSSTRGALSLFEWEGDEFFLPRIFMNFDDVVGCETRMYNQFTGELAAINDFNIRNEAMKIAENRVFRSYNVNFGWYHQSFVMHRFLHRDYGVYISGGSPSSLALR